MPRGDATYEHISQLAVTDGMVLYKCQKCDCIKPERAHHCRCATEGAFGKRNALDINALLHYTVVCLVVRWVCNQTFLCFLFSVYAAQLRILFKVKIKRNKRSR